MATQAIEGVTLTTRHIGMTCYLRRDGVSIPVMIARWGEHFVAVREAREMFSSAVDAGSLSWGWRDRD